jgi:hypothetical protein
MTEASFLVDPTPSGGTLLSINGTDVIAIEPLGTPTEPPIGATEQGQHYIATLLVGPDAGRKLRITPCAKVPIVMPEPRYRVRYA